MLHVCAFLVGLVATTHSIRSAPPPWERAASRRRRCLAPLADVAAEVRRDPGRRYQHGKRRQFCSSTRGRLQAGRSLSDLQAQAAVRQQQAVEVDAVANAAPTARGLAAALGTLPAIIVVIAGSGLGEGGCHAGGRICGCMLSSGGTGGGSCRRRLRQLHRRAVATRLVVPLRPPRGRRRPGRRRQHIRGFEAGSLLEGPQQQAEGGGGRAEQPGPWGLQ
mmetsp:Transcript_77110/g.213111  ORF Transcript_77110/g.213111 Transcript_77110/m.213111 type:complete len:220 (+) Transcript_77110:280-939(+)